MMERADSAQLEAILHELARLNDRVATLEANAASQPQAAATCTSAAPFPAPPAENLSEELVLVIGAAVAAWLGKKPHLVQVHLIGSLPWTQQGRVTVQASHTLSERSRRVSS